MPYTTNPAMPRIRREAADLFRRGWSARKIGRHLGYHHTAVMKWVRKARKVGYHPIPTRSSRPKTHGRQLSRELVQNIVAKRLLLRRSAEVVHRVLHEEGVMVSLSSVKRTLDRQGLVKKRSPYKRYHAPSKRPAPTRPGSLVEVDTVHLALHGKTVLYVYTLVDVYSRFAYAWCSTRATCRASLLFVKRAQVAAPFRFDCVQTDNGSEFSTHFSERLGVRHRHTRVRQSNDNAHVERFNRTLREECLDAAPLEQAVIDRALAAYLKRYNTERHHFGLDLKTPAQILAQVVPRY